MQLIKITRMLGLLVFVCLPALADFGEDGTDHKPKSGEQWKASNNEHLKSYQEWKAHNREFERFFATKKYYEAFLAGYKSLNIAQAHAAPNHPATLLSQSNLAQAEGVGDSALYKSLPAGHPALSIGTILGPRRVSEREWNRCGGLYLSMCRYGEKKLSALDTAIRRYQETLAIQEKELGPNHPSLARNLLGLGDAYRNLKQDLSAKVHYERALPILTRRGSDPKKMTDLLESLAYIYRVEGDLNRSVLYFERSLLIKMKTLKPNHPDLVVPLRNLSGLYVVLKRDKESEKLEKLAALIEAKHR